MDFDFVVESTGNRGSRCQLGKHELVFDMPPAAGGDGRGPGPLAVFIVSAAACMHYFASGVFTTNDLPVEGLRVKVQAHQTSDSPSRLGTLAFEVVVPEGTSDEIRAAVLEAVQRCPVHNTLGNPPAVDVTIA